MLQRLTDHPRYATRHSLTPETIGIGHPGVPLIYLIYLRSSTPINTWIRSRGSDASHSSRDRLQEGAYATQRTPTSKIVIHRGNCAKLRLERIELRARARAWDSGSWNVISHPAKGARFARFVTVIADRFNRCDRFSR